MGGRRSRGMNGSFQAPNQCRWKNGEQNEGRTKLKGEQNEGWRGGGVVRDVWCDEWKECP